MQGYQNNVMAVPKEEIGQVVSRKTFKMNQLAQIDKFYFAKIIRFGFVPV